MSGQPLPYELSCCGTAIPEDLPPLPNKKLVWVSAGVLIDTEGSVLIAQRPEGKAMAGLWEFPGGKIEAGETPEYTLCRELREELDIRTGESCLLPIHFLSHSYQDFHLCMPVFAIRQWIGTPQAKEHKALQWVKPSELYKIPMPEADKPLISVLIELLEASR
tara:strand:+ start:150 stop:638 length:489 start_codon:yes stop_codon:yes gene_type:complete